MRARRQARADGEDARHAVARLQARKVHAPPERPSATGSRTRRTRAGRARRRTRLEGVRRSRRVRRRVFDVERGERLLVMGLERRGKTTLLRILADARRRRLAIRSRHGVQLGLLRAGARGDPRRIDAARTCIARPRRTTRRSARSSGCSACRGAGVPGRGHALRRREDEAALAQLVAGRKNLLLLDEPTNNLDPAVATAAARRRDWPGAMVS